MSSRTTYSSSTTTKRTDGLPDGSSKNTISRRPSSCSTTPRTPALPAGRSRPIGCHHVRGPARHLHARDGRLAVPGRVLVPPRTHQAVTWLYMHTSSISPSDQRRASTFGYVRHYVSKPLVGGDLKRLLPDGWHEPLGADLTKRLWLDGYMAVWLSDQPCSHNFPSSQYG
jgi:hypothetical protein